VQSQPFSFPLFAKQALASREGGPASCQSNMPDNEELTPVPTTPTSERPRSFFARNSISNGQNAEEEEDVEESEEEKGQKPTKWSMGVLNDRSTNEVPGMFIGSGEQLKTISPDFVILQDLSFSSLVNAMNLLVFETPQPECLPLPCHNNLQCQEGYPMLLKLQKTRRQPKMEQLSSNLNQMTRSMTP
jgi:hypothetical protein